MSKLQWYVFTVLRVLALAALVWSIGTWLDRADLSSVAKDAIDFFVVVLGIFLVNNWVVSYKTHLDDERQGKSPPE